MSAFFLLAQNYLMYQPKKIDVLIKKISSWCHISSFGMA